jgi:hypothetical protein
MDSQATVAIIGALVGAFTGILVALLTNWQQSRLEYQKWLRTREDELQRWMQAREDEVVKDLRLAIAELTKILAIGAHTMGWLTWNAKYDSANLTEEDMVDYNKRMQVLLPEIVGARILVAALDKDIHAQMGPIIERLYELDEELASRSALFKSSPQEGIKALAECKDIQAQLVTDLLERATELIGLEQVRAQFAPRGPQSTAVPS